MYLRIIIIFLSIFATILRVHADGETFTDGDFTFRVISDNECEVTGSPNPPNPLVIPSTATFNGNVYTVTRIGSAAFFDRKACVIVYHGEGTYFGDLVLPNTITSIGDSAFMNCKGLTGSLKLPEGLMTIGKRAFSGCGKVTYFPGDGDIYVEGEAWASGDTLLGFTGPLIIPESVTTIGYQAFRGSNFSGDLIIPDAVTELGLGAFDFTLFNGKLKISNSLKVIKERTFFGFVIQDDLKIPDSVTAIKSDAFGHCRFNGKLILSNNLTTKTVLLLLEQFMTVT